MSQRRTSPSLIAAQAHLREALADRPVPCRDLRISDVDRGAFVAAKRREGIEIVRVGGEPHYRLPQTPPRSSS